MNPRINKWRARAAVVLSACALAACAGKPARVHVDWLAADVKPAPDAQAIPSISGIAPLGDDRFIVVHDVKADLKGAADRPQAFAGRCGVITFVNHGVPTYQPLVVSSKEVIPGHDLESIARNPREPSEFFMLESGDGKPASPRRLFRVRIEEREQKYTAAQVGDAIDLRPSTAALGNIEAMLVLEHGPDGLLLVLADRSEQDGAVENPRVKFQTLVLDAAGKVQPGPEWKPATLTGAFDAHWRLCADLCLDANSDVCLAAALDPGDAGPFDSRVYRIGRLVDGVFEPDPLGPSREVFGQKVEALCAGRLTADDDNHKPVTRSVLMLASDNENLGGPIGAAAMPAEWPASAARK